MTDQSQSQQSAEVETEPPSTVTRTLEWVGGTSGHLKLLDQTLLPTECSYRELDSVKGVWEAIKVLCVRGAPAIGVAAAYGLVLGCRKAADARRDEFDSAVKQAADYLATSRPTAVNLFWALDRMQSVVASHPDLGSAELLARLLAEAQAIEAEDVAMCAAIGKHGAALLNDGQGVLTHCNAGALATAGDGTALSLFFEAARQGKNLHIYADETRPLLQGARLTSWELQQRGITVTVICDSVAATVMKEGRVQAVVTGADRIAGNGDAANKIGTYSIAALAHLHDIPVYIAAPSSTFDLSLASGDEIPIEERSAAEVTNGFGQQTAPDDVDVYNPAFDVTPAKYIRALVTEKGVITPVTADNIREVLSR